MADDEVENPPGPQGAKPAMPNRGRQRRPEIIEGTATDLTPAAESEEPVAAPAEADSAETPAGETQAVDREAPPAEELAAAIGEPAGDPDAVDTPLRAESRSRMPMIVSVLGLVVVILLAAVLYGLYNPPANEAVAGLSRDVADLKSRLAAVEAKAPPPPVDLKPLDARVAALEAKPADGAPDLKSIEDRLAAVEATASQLKTDLAAAQQKLGQAASQDTQGAPAPDLAPLQKRMADLETRQKALQDAVAAVPKTDLGPIQKQEGDLAAQVKTVQDQVAGLPKVDLAPLSSRIDDLGQRVAGIVATVAAIPHVDLGPVDARVDALDKRLQPIEAQLSAAKSQQQVTEARENGTGAETRAAPLAITAQAIEEAVASGRPFTSELAALEKLGADAQAIEALKPVAETGTATQAQLIAGFEENQGRMVGPSAPAPTGNVLDRMMAGAQNLVKVRKEGANPGQDPDEVVARIGADLRKGDFKAAFDEWNGLPEEGRTATHAWADKLKARVRAEAAARSIVASAIAAIGSTP